MIKRVSIKNFKRFREQTFELDGSVVLAGPNNTGKSTLLQAIATWKFGINCWAEHRQKTKSKAEKRSGVAIQRADITSVPLREMNLLWKDRKVAGLSGKSGPWQLITIDVEGQSNGEKWRCGLEIKYANPESVYVRPLGVKDFDPEKIKDFPPPAAAELDIVYIPPLSGIERDEPRRDRGMQDLLIGQGRPGEILRNLLLQISEKENPNDWNKLSKHVRDLFNVELLKPAYTPEQPHIICEYRESARDPSNLAKQEETKSKKRRSKPKPLDLSSAGSGTLQVLLLLAFLYARPAAVILLDEPDAHQYPMLQKQVYSLIRKIARERGAQVIAASHSEAIIDMTEPTRLIGFGGQNPCVLVHKEQRKQMNQALKLVTTKELMFVRDFNGVLYLEGKSDEQILAEWAKILDHPARTILERSFVHPLEGNVIKKARDHLFAMQGLYPTIRAVCLLDGDNSDEPGQETLPSGLVVLRWNRYEIENYLLNPEAIKRFINFPLLDSEVDKRFWKQVPPGTDLFGDHTALQRIKASDEFLVPLFDELKQDILKSDLYLLAAAMKQDEIHPEVKEKLDRIAEHLAPKKELKK